MTLSAPTLRAIRKYGEQTCRDAYDFALRGEGASSIACGTFVGIVCHTTRMVDAAINAGRELAERETAR